jgi:FixJ family two-component response regulator
VVVVAIIDDDASILDAMTLLIEGEGWVANAYASGEAFLEDHRENGKVDCLILDPHLDGISGAVVAQALVNAHIPIIGLTARPESLITRRVIEYGVETMLTKPVRPGELVATIRRAIDGKT